MTNKTLLQEIADLEINRENGGIISLTAKTCLKEGKEDECIKMLKSMTFDNEALMIRCLGEYIVEQIKLA